MARLGGNIKQIHGKTLNPCEKCGSLHFAAGILFESCHSMANFIVILNGKLHFAAGILFESCHSMANFIVIWMESKPNVRQGKVIVLKFGFKRFGQQVPFERPPKPPTFWNSYTRTLILDTIMKLSGTIGVTQKTMTLDTHVRLILLQT